MAFTVQDLDKLDNAIKNGRRRVKYNDKEVEYRTMDEMMTARSFIIGQLETTGLMTSSAQVGSTSYASFSRD